MVLASVLALVVGSSLTDSLRLLASCDNLRCSSSKGISCSPTPFPYGPDVSIFAADSNGFSARLLLGESFLNDEKKFLGNLKILVFRHHLLLSHIERH